MEKKSTSTEVSQVLAHHDDRLSSILEQVRKIHIMQKAVATILTADLAAHCEVANYREGIVIMQCDHPTWAAKLRMQSMQILTQLRAEKIYVTQIQIQIAPLSRHANTGYWQANPLDAQSESILANLRQQLED